MTRNGTLPPLLKRSPLVADDDDAIESPRTTPPDWLFSERAATLQLLLTGSFRLRSPIGAFHVLMHGLRAMEQLPTDERTADLRQSLASQLSRELAEARKANLLPNSVNRAVAIVTMIAAARALSVEIRPRDWSAWGVTAKSNRATVLAGCLSELYERARGPTALAADAATVFWVVALVSEFAEGVFEVVGSERAVELREFAADVRRVLDGQQPESPRLDAPFAYARTLATRSEDDPATAAPLTMMQRVRLILGGHYARWNWATRTTTALLAVALVLAGLGTVWFVRGNSATDAFTETAIRPLLQELGSEPLSTK